MLAAELASRLDFSRADRRNRSFVPPNLHKQETDLLYRVPFRDLAEPEREVLIYLLAEHQLVLAVRYLEDLPEEAQVEWRHAMQFLLLLIQHK